jgi:hypothetical protein
MKLPEKGQTWVHFKGARYTIVCTARLEADLTPVVVYMDVGSGIWVRPIDNFLEGVKNANGEIQPRFVLRSEP